MLFSDNQLNDYTRIYNLYFARIFGLAYAKTGNPEDARDIAQEVFSRLYLKYTEINDPSKWIFGTLNLVVLEHYRKKRDPHLTLDDDHGKEGLVYLDSHNETRMLIRDAMEDYNNFRDETEKNLFALVALHDYSFNEAGRELGLSERQAGYRYNLILRRLINYLEKKGITKLEDLL